MVVGGRAMICVLLLVSAIASASCNGAAAPTDGGQLPAPAGPDTNVLCVSKCGTCGPPPACSSRPPPSSSSDAGDNTVPPNSGGSVYSSPPSPKSAGGAYTPAPPGQGKGGQPSNSNYYYFFTAAGGRSSCAGAGVYASALLALVPLVANFQ